MVDRRIVAAACGVALLSVSSVAFATSYASSVTESAGTVNFILNDAADDVIIIRDGVPQSLGALGRGAQSFARNGAAQYQIVVRKTNVAGYAYNTGTIATQNGPIMPNGGLVQVTDDADPQWAYRQPRGMGINTNPANGANFGRVYVSNGQAGVTLGTSLQFRAVQDGLYVVGADGSDPLGQGDGGVGEPDPTANPSIARTGGVPMGGSLNDPFQIDFDDDGRAYVALWGDANGSVYRYDPDLTTGVNLLNGTGPYVGPFAPDATRNHGSVPAAVPVGGGNNVTLYTVEEDLSPTGTTNQMNSLWRHDIGATLPTTAVPTQLASGLLIGDVNGVQADLDRGPDGKFYYSQYRIDGNQATMFVLAPDGVTPLFSTLAESQRLGLDGLADNAATLSTQGIQDVLRDHRNISASPDGRWLALVEDNSKISAVPLIEGIPDLANIHYIDAWSTGISAGRSVAVDAAGNMYLSSSGEGGIRGFSAGGVSETTYSSNGTFKLRGEPDYNGTGNYSDSSKWLLGAVQNGADGFASFGTTDTGTNTVTIDSAVSMAKLRFVGGSYTLSGSNPIAMGTGNDEPRLIAEAGNHTVSAPLAISRNIGYAAYAGANLTVTNPQYASASVNVTKWGNGVVTHPAINQDNVAVRFGTLKIATGGGTSKVKALDINEVAASGATLDLGNNAFVVDYEAGNSPLAEIQAQITSGRNGGAWTGTGITSSAAAAAPGLFGVGFGEASTLNLTNFAGVPVDADAVVFRYTRLGDADLSGTVSLDDFTALASSFGGTGSWINGDFNFDGNINLDDFTPLAANFGLSAGDAPRGAAVPEPASLGIIAAAAMGLARRRRA